ncbi:hypothetical protein [Nguyenibacter vanlangensis]|uniref:hypothetical protein n=1 Tax=Nguyenibacter vanlangensis TaxID=1216886 RepID=UPI00293945E2|nr:hypothetical protein [Nguyenibacter vanlangensis]
MRRIAVRVAIARAVSCMLGACVLGTGATLLASSAAHAQRVITDDEAGRLTLDALTAPPPVRHIVYRRAFHASYGVPAAHAHAYRMATRPRAIVRTVAYHPHVAASGRHGVSRVGGHWGAASHGGHHRT